MQSSEELNCYSIITSKELWEYYQDSVDIVELLTEEEDSLPWWKWFSAKLNFYCQSKPHKHRSFVVQEKSLLTAISQSQYDNNDEVHKRVLYTLFRKLIHDVESCPRFGPHWELLGFQGSDPATDLRGVGMLGLLLPLSLVTRNETLPFMMDVLALSRHSEKGFPFMVLSLNVAQIVLTSLRDGHLDKISCHYNSVLQAALEFYGGILYFIYDKWRKENLTLVDSGHLLQRAGKTCKKDVNSCINHFENYLTSLAEPAKTIVENHTEIDPNQISLDFQIT